MIIRIDETYVCPECYLAVHYGADEVLSEHWDSTAFLKSTVGQQFVGDTCTEHDHQEYEEGKCLACGHESDGIIDFSYTKCDMCLSPLGGARYRVTNLKDDSDHF